MDVDAGHLAHRNLGGEFLRADRVVEARHELEQALAECPDDEKALNLYGLALFRLGELPLALSIYEGLVARFPDNATIRLNLGLIHLKTGTLDTAIEQLSRARELSPGQRRIAGYLGLAHARRGDYEVARIAFLAAGQDDLARDMERALAGQGGAAASAVPDRAPHPVNNAVVVPEPSSLCECAPDLEDRDHVASAPRASPQHAAPLSVAAFATAELVTPDEGEASFEPICGGGLVVRIDGAVYARTAAVVAAGGRFASYGATRRVRGMMSQMAFGGESAPVCRLAGRGYLVVKPAGGRFETLRLADDILYVREELVFGFEERLLWENGGIPGAGGAISIVQFRGKGLVALRVDAPLLRIKLGHEKAMMVDAGALVGWIGRVVPRVLVGPQAGGGPTFCECMGEGVVLLGTAAPTEVH